MKKERQAILLEKLEQDPFLTDEELSEMLGVSVPTIRLDRLELGIPELRERIKNVAQKNYSKVKSLQVKDIVGELVDITLGKSGISILEPIQKWFLKKPGSFRDIIYIPWRNPLPLR